MSIVLPKREQINKLYPVDAVATLKNPTTGGSYAATYAQLVASTANDYVLTGIYLLAVFTESAASFSGAIPFEFKVAIGGSSSEVDIASGGGAVGVQYTFATGSVAQLGTATFHRLPAYYVPAGTRLSYNTTTSATHSLFMSAYISGYEVSSGYPLPRPFDNMEAINSYLRGMRAPTGITVPNPGWNTISTGSPSWTYGSTVEMIASASTDIIITHVLSTIVDSISVTTHAHIEVGIGAAGSEVWKSVVGAPGAPGMPGPGGGQLELDKPLYVKAGERVACRAKGTASKTFTVALNYIILK